MVVCKISWLDLKTLFSKIQQAHNDIVGIKYFTAHVSNTESDPYKADLQDAYIRLVVTRGIGDLGLDMRKCKHGATLFIIADKIELYPEEYYDKGLTLVTSTIRQKGLDQVTPGVKSLNYLANILARAEATAAGAQEAILLNATMMVSVETMLITPDSPLLAVPPRILMRIIVPS